MRALTASTIAVLLLVGGAVANPVLDRIDAMEDGKLQIDFEAREGVWGDGKSIMTFSDEPYRHRRYGSRELEPGPIRVLFTVRDGEVTHLKTRVGGRETLSDRAELMGWTESQVAAEALMHLARSARSTVAEDAIGAAVLAADVELAAELLEIARDRDRRDDVREAAIFWLGQEAGDKIAGDLEDFIEDDVEELEFREHAIFALSQRPDRESVPALIRVARNNGHPELRRTALFWLSQHDDDRVVDLFEEILTD